MTSGKHPVEQPEPGRAPGRWQGETYFDHQQLKPWPFDPFVVGAYVFLAGLSGASALIGALAHGVAARRPDQRREAQAPLVRRSRYLSLLAPTIGSALLIYDLHSPKRFYNMLRVAKARSPMSIGTWTLMGFAATAGVSGVCQMLADIEPRWRWPLRVAAVAQVPSAVTGAGLGTYTAALISATSAPGWSAAPRPLAVRFASSSIATAAAALSLTEREARTRRSLDKLLLAALTVELVAGIAVEQRYSRTGIKEALRKGRWGRAELIAATGFGTLLPLGLLLASRLAGHRGGRVAKAADVAAIAGSLVMRVSVLGMGAESAANPAVSLRFAQPDNLPLDQRSR